MSIGNGSGSYDNDDDSLTYEWSLDGNIIAEGAIFTHTIDNVGTYTVTLTVSDGFHSDSDTVQVNIVDVSSISGYIRATKTVYTSSTPKYVTVKLYKDGELIESVLTRSSELRGWYWCSDFSFNNLSLGTYNIVPSKALYYFVPSSQTVTISEPGSSITGVRFTIRRR